MQTVHSRITNDGFANYSRKLGTEIDPRNQTQYQTRYKITQIPDLLSEMYSTNWITKNIIDVPVEDALREGRTIKNLDEDKIKIFIKEYNKIEKKISHALKVGRLHGGCVIVIVGGGAVSEPLGNIKKGELINIAVLEPNDYTSFDIDMSPLSPTYLRPTTIQISGGEVVHESRFLIVDGESTTNYEREQNNGFGYSIIEKMYNEIQDASVSNGLIRGLLEQAKQDIIKYNGLNELAASNQLPQFEHRLRTINAMKSIFSQLAIDKEDDYQVKQISFSGLPQIQSGFYQVVAGASRIPYTKLMGKSADGMNATGEGDMKNYYDTVKSNIQNGELAEVYEWLDPIVSMHLFGDKLDIDYEFNPLYQMSEKEMADKNKVEAETYAILIANGIIPSEAVLKEYHKDGVFLDYEYEEMSDEH